MDRRNLRVHTTSSNGLRSELEVLSTCLKRSICCIAYRKFKIESIELDALEWISDYLLEYLRSWGTLTRNLSNLAGRSESNFVDLLNGLYNFDPIRYKDLLDCSALYAEDSASALECWCRPPPLHMAEKDLVAYGAWRLPSPYQKRLELTTDTLDSRLGNDGIFMPVDYALGGTANREEITITPEFAQLAALNPEFVQMSDGPSYMLAATKNAIGALRLKCEALGIPPTSLPARLTLQDLTWHKKIVSPAESDVQIRPEAVYQATDAMTAAKALTKFREFVVSCRDPSMNTMDTSEESLVLKYPPGAATSQVSVGQFLSQASTYDEPDDESTVLEQERFQVPLNVNGWLPVMPDSSSAVKVKYPDPTHCLDTDAVELVTAVDCQSSSLLCVTQRKLGPVRLGLFHGQKIDGGEKVPAVTTSMTAKTELLNSVQLDLSRISTEFAPVEKQPKVCLLPGLAGHVSLDEQLG